MRNRRRTRLSRRALRSGVEQLVRAGRRSRPGAASAAILGYRPQAYFDYGRSDQPFSVGVDVARGGWVVTTAGGRSRPLETASTGRRLARSSRARSCSSPRRQ
jgi:hypothetical protein